MKDLIVFKPHSIVDIITNSSSELFVFEGNEKEVIEEMIRQVYPNYDNEYEELKSIMELSVEELDNFISYHCSPHRYPARRADYPLIGDYTFEELYEPEEGGRAWNGELQYQLKDNSRPPKNLTVKKFDDFINKDIDPYSEENWNNDEEEYEDKWHIRRFVTLQNHTEVINRICPEHNLYFMYSLDENPNWDYQEKLEEIGGIRYHLG